jgi:metallo-beta-lactamase family protein
MVADATDIFRRHPECFDRTTQEFLGHDDPFGFRELRYLRSVDESKTVNGLAGPFVVIATSGMCESGRILHHLHRHLGDPRSMLAFVSYQAPDTLGARLMAGASPVNVFGEPHEVRLTVRTLPSFSAHADAPELMAWVSRMPSVGRISLVHGEEAESLALAARLRDAGYDAGVPDARVPIAV